MATKERSSRPGEIRLRRVYEPAERGDGMRILVERLWPRGVSKEAARVELWLKEIAPTPALRKWFGHDPAKWEGFRRKYHQELAKNPEAVARLREAMGEGAVTLVYAARDEAHNSAVALKEYLLAPKAPRGGD